MRECAGARTPTTRRPRTLLKSVFTGWVLFLSACSGDFETSPLVEFSTEVVISGTRPALVTRQLEPGVYLLEVRERDIDVRVAVDTEQRHSELADGQPRHGLHRLVVSLHSPSRLRVTLRSVDQESWKGAAAVRFLRWPQSPPDSAPDHRLFGFRSQGKANALLALETPDSWRAAVPFLRDASRHFQAAGDSQSTAEVEYQRSHVELGLLFDAEAGRRSAETALAQFRAAGDAVGEQRAAMLLGMAEFDIASRMGPQATRVQQQSLLNTATRRVLTARKFFEAQQFETDALTALGLARMRETILGHGDDNASAFESIRRRAHARGDVLFEVHATRNLAAIAQRKGDAVRAVALYESVLPLVSLDRNPGLHAALRSDLGSALTTLGEFDRAHKLHAEALEVFTARGDDSRTAREIAALAFIRMRSGDVERALGMLESAFPLYERSEDRVGHVSALRLAGHAAGELGQHDQAIGYLRKAEFHDRNGVTIDHTRVLIAGELRVLGDLRGAEELLAQVLQTTDASTRADALTERAQLRMRQHRYREALADLREADATYARLQLDFNRIESSASLALALLDAGDLAGASAAADVAVAMERRIRGKAADPETRARLLSASYAPYEARIEAHLAAWPADRNAVWRAFRTAETVRARSLADRLAQGARDDTARDDAEIRALRATVSVLQAEFERLVRNRDSDLEATLGARRRLVAGRARLEARLLEQAHAHATYDLDIPESRAAVQTSLPDDTAVLAFFVGERRSHAWLLTRRDLRHSVLPGRRVLEDLVSASIAWHRSGGKQSQGAAFPPLLGNLLDGIDAKRLLILPDGPLNSLPFATLSLPRGTTSEILIDRFVIGSAPSLAVALRQPPPPAVRATLVAVVSDPVYTPDDRRLSMPTSSASRFRGAADHSERLARLPYSAVEARAVSRAFNDANVIGLAGFDATARRVIELPSRELGVLHFATHAIAREDSPGQSALFLSEYAADGSPLPTGRLTAEDITRSGLRADVVVLSGCSTGGGRELRGEGVLGLTYGFLANGSKTVVASLWPVEDALTARFMEEFYSAYRASGRAADALRVAQLRTRNNAGPTVWSSFVVRSNGMP